MNGIEVSKNAPARDETGPRRLLAALTSPGLRKNLGPLAGLIGVFALFAVLVGTTRGINFADAANIEDYVNVDPALFRPAADFLLRVRGDSMKDADILDRDLLAVHRTKQVRNGQIVVARLGDEATVKYYRRQGQLVRLEPANPEYAPIEIDLREQELAIEGLATGVIRTVLSRRS